MGVIKYEHTVEYLNANKPAGSLLTALYVEIRKWISPLVFCKCLCGGYSIVQFYNFLNSTKSCGCKKKRQSINRKFFPSIKALHSVWFSMIDRCYNSKCNGYKNYGGRGVIVCEEWRNDYQKFLDWALANGWEKGLQLDKDIKGNGLLYSPDTCRFVTRKKNCNNTRRNKKYLYNDEYYSLSELSELTGKSWNSLNLRINIMGMSVKDAVESKVKFRKRGRDYRVPQKLTKEDVVLILTLNKEGKRKCDILRAIDNKVSRRTLDNVLEGTIWNHVNISQ